MLKRVFYLEVPTYEKMRKGEHFHSTSTCCLDKEFSRNKNLSSKKKERK